MLILDTIPSVLFFVHPLHPSGDQREHTPAQPDGLRVCEMGLRGPV